MFPDFAPTPAGLRRSCLPCLPRRTTALVAAVMAVLVVPALGPPPVQADQAPRPNIVLVLADDLGYSDLGCYGGEIATPHIDALARHGARFTQFYNSARCCPSRASLMTGLYPSQAGIGDFTTDQPSPTRGPGYLGRLNDQCVTLAEALKPAGYGCYYVGKWHLHEKTGPIQRGFDEFYGYTRGHSHDQYDPDYYVRLPEGRRPERTFPDGQFYATDAFNEYALEFIRQGQKSGKPWLLFLGHSSPHFPLQAPAERADKYESTYRQGWDVLRERRFARMREIGLIDGQHWQLTPRSLVPVDRQDIANGFPGRPNPAWDSLDDERQRDLARRMSVFAAMVEAVDQGVGRIVEHLRATGELDNTLILVLSDNGACYEWGPFGFDGPSRRGLTTLRTGDELRQIGGPGTHQSYGSGWANLGNTPFRLYKHFTHEGGISTPCIVHWPAGIGKPDRWLRQPAHVMDILPTLLEVSGASYPSQLRGQAVTPLEGTSLLAALRGGRLPERSLGFEHQGARAFREGDWKLVWSKRMPHEIQWELYDLASDRCETRDVAAKDPERVREMAERWEQWARRVGVIDSGPEVVDHWRYTLRQPADGWPAPGFDTSGWKEGFGGFGTRETPGARVGTTWATNQIWLRKEFSLTAIPDQAALLIHHDEDARVYLNGTRVADLKGFTTDYKLVTLEPAMRSLLRVGRNLLAVHCRQTLGGQFIDAHLVDAQRVPKLPAPRRDTRPFESELMTRWGQQVTEDNAWREYPRPQLRRADWTNLNGHWDYAITPADQRQAPGRWAGKILVPFSLESRLGGVRRLLGQDEALWYRRPLAAKRLAGKRTILHFEAVDYRCTVYVNGTPLPAQTAAGPGDASVLEHVGGNTPFWLDVTDALRDDGRNELIVRVEDDTEAWQLRGKQTLNPRGIWYTQVSGIWQTVWLEQVPAAHIRDLKIATDAASGSITVRPAVAERETAGEVELVVRDGQRVVARQKHSGDEFRLVVEHARLWSPASPHLYDIDATLFDRQGNPLDRVRSYAGIRTVGKLRDAQGHWRFTLNGQPIFHWGPLDQGWWPDGLLTPPSDEAMRFDIEWLKSAGFNMIRKHIKVEPRRYYYHCDRLGMMVWQDHVSGGEQPPWTRLQPDPVDARWPPQQHRQFLRELERMIATLENHPSIVCWVPFNESWGQHQTLEVGRRVVERDPSRLVNIASGGNFWPVGDVVDAHHYPHPEFPFEQGQGGRFDDYIKVMGEFGGHGYPVPGHLWDAERRNWGYGGLPRNEAEYRERYVTSLKLLNQLRRKGIAAGVYTQTTDVEGEVNGLLTYDRKVVKIPAERLAELHRMLFEALPAD